MKNMEQFSSENMTPEESKSEKESVVDKKEAWEKKEKDITDRHGDDIDKRIKEVVVAFEMSGLPLDASCEGHLDHGEPIPWVQVSFPNEPEEIFIGENRIFQETADKYGIPVEDVKKMKDFNAWNEARAKMPESIGRTPEHKQWEEENRKLQDKTDNLLKEFYKERESPKNLKLTTWRLSGTGCFRVYVGIEDKILSEELKGKHRLVVSKLLPKRQKEMQEFATFLKKKYFEE